MRILVVDPDDGFARGLARKLSSKGHAAEPVLNPGQLQAQLRIRSVDVVIIDLSRRRMNGFEVARSLRNRFDSQSLDIVLTSPKHQQDDAEVQVLMKDVEARYFYSKPIDEDALVADLNKPRPKKTMDTVPTARSSAPQPASVRSKPAPQPASVRSKPRRKAPAVVKPKVDISWDNAKEILAIWAERRTGQMVLASEALSGAAPIVEGGLVNPDDQAIVGQALKGGIVAFRDGTPDGSGDWNLLGKVLFQGARVGCEAKTIRRYLHAVPVRTSDSDLCRSLPISADSRKVMGHLDGTRTFAEVLERSQVTSGDISVDFETLIQLGLLELRAVDEGEGSARAASGVDGGSSSESPVTDIDALPTMDAESVAQAHSKQTPEQMQKRLEREWNTIRDSPPPVVLGVPADSVARVVDAAAARMRNRYARLIADAGLPKEVRDLAQKVAQIVDRSHRSFDFVGSVQTGQVDATRARGPASDLEQLLQEGRALIAKSEWARADKVLTKAHEHQLDHAQVLANLGWARLHNPARNSETRTEEGRDFLLLAEQFDPCCSEGQFYLAQVLYASGQLAAAVQRAERATESAPDDPARAALHRKLKKAATAQ